MSAPNAAPYASKVITANTLIDGDVVYLTPSDDWSKALADAEIFTDEAHAQARLRDAEMQHDQIIGAYLAPVSLTSDGPAPAHFREVFRATGPSNYPHGKQEAHNV